MDLDITELRMLPGTAYIWQIDDALHGGDIRSCRRLLSHEEKERADRFHFEKDRRCFTAARAASRTILAQYLNVRPEGIVFAYGPRGKPELARSLNGSGLKFNLSHSRERILLAVTLNSCIGVDIEFIDHRVPTDVLASRFFSPRELTALGALQPEDRQSAFFNCWTRKEAYIKAVGEGLSLALDSFDVAFGPGIPAELLWVQASPEQPSRWSMYEIPVPQGYAAAVVIEGRNHRVEQKTWEWKL